MSNSGASTIYFSYGTGAQGPGDARETGISLREAKGSVPVLVLDNPEMRKLREAFHFYF